jgi:UDP-glucose 4-epimerase
MKFTVFGASGFIGSHLARYLRAQGHDVYAPERGDTQVFDESLGHAVYCIGMTADFARYPHATVEAHVGLLSRYLREANFDSLLYLSSTRLYDGCSGFCREDTDLVLNPANPRHLFDFSKGLGESLCHASGRPEVRIARLSNVYADDLSADNFLHGLTKSALARKRVKVSAPVNAARDYVHMDDVCRLLEVIALKGRRSVYNVASGENVTNADLFALVAELTGVRIAGGAPQSGPTAPTICVEAAQTDFKFRPAPLEFHLRRILAARPKLATGR